MYPAGLGIVYYEIGKGPEEERADREDQEWALKNGLLSPSDVMMIRNPGMSREDALIELARVQREAGAQSPAVEAAALALDDLAERVPPDVAAEIRRIAAGLEGAPEDVGAPDPSDEDAEGALG